MNEVKLPEKAEKAFSYIKELVDSYEKQISDLKQENEFFNNFTPAEQLIPYKNDTKENNPDKVYWEEFKESHLHTGWYHPDSNKPEWIKLGWTVERCQNLLRENKEIQQKNQETIKRNTGKYNKIFNLFKRLGLSETKYVQVKTRSRFSSYKTEKQSCEWPSELGKVFPRYDTFGSLEHSYEKAINFIQNYEAAKQRHLDIKKSQEEAELKNKQKYIVFAELNSKYKLGLSADKLEYYEVLDKLLKQNKYLYLGHYLLENRNSWEDGYNLAEKGLNYFNTFDEKNNDAAISKSIQDRINNWDNDGRTFRDNPIGGYDNLFGIVQNQNLELYQDYNKLKEYSNE